MFEFATNPNKERRNTTEVGTVYKNIVLDGVKALRVDKARVTYNVTREFDLEKGSSSILSKQPLEEQIEHMCLEFVEVTPKELAYYRRKKIPSFVLKAGDKLYYTTIPKNITFLGTDILGSHMCGQQCCHLSPVSDEEGGCAKVRNYATFIEKYPWIKKGYETFGTRVDSFVVVECSHYKRLPSGRIYPITETELKKDDFTWLLKRPF